MAYNLIGSDRLDAWFDTADSHDCTTMANWVQALINGPLEVASGAFQQAHTGRLAYWSHVPGTAVIVTYVVIDAPVRAVSILSVIPAP